jgi:phenylalanyl-tRNA synthetase beta subunit
MTLMNCLFSRCLLRPASTNQPINQPTNQPTNHPPLFSEYSKISPETKDVFIEVTGTDLNKTQLVLNTIVTSFSKHCAAAYTVESVTVVGPEDGQSVVYPQLETRNMQTTVSYLNRGTGLELCKHEMKERRRTREIERNNYKAI